MKNYLLKLFLLNLLLGVLILIAFYLSAFLSGYASNVSYLPQEKKLFIKFAIFHFLVNIFFLYKYKQLNWIGIIGSIGLIVAFYLLLAWQFDYFK